MLESKTLRKRLLYLDKCIQYYIERVNLELSDRLNLIESPRHSASGSRIMFPSVVVDSSDSDGTRCC